MLFFVLSYIYIYNYVYTFRTSRMFSTRALVTLQASPIRLVCFVCFFFFKCCFVLHLQTLRLLKCHLLFIVIGCFIFLWCMCVCFYWDVRFASIAFECL